MNRAASVMDWMARSSGRAFLIVFLLAIVVRCAILFSWLTPLRHIYPQTSSEVSLTALELARTGEYANPYVVPTGPTAHAPPINTGLLALLYRLCGVTLTAGYVRCLVGIASYSVMYAMLPWLAGRFGLGRQAGLLSGIAGALIPDQGLYEVIGWTWTEPHAAVALALLLVVCVKRWTRANNSAVSSLLLGMGFGVAFHLVPAILLVMLGCIVFELWWRQDREQWWGAVLITAGAAAACAPWTLRNYAAFGEVFFLRSNLGLELRMGNHDGAAADIEVIDARAGERMRHPGSSESEARLVRELGELEYMRRARQEAVAWIVDHPGEFIRLTALRFVHFWCGSLHRPEHVAWTTLLTLLALLGMRHSLPGMTVPQRAGLLIPLVTFPLIYYVVFYMSRYRVPLNWVLLIFAGAEVWHWLKRLPRPRHLAGAKAAGC